MLDENPSCNMSFDDWKFYIDYFQGIHWLMIAGGEPTTHPELNKMLIHARKEMPDCFFHLLSNGLFDKEVFSGFDITKNFLCDVNLPEDSKDDKKVVENIEFLKENGISVPCTVILNEDSDFDRIEKFIIQYCGWADLRIALPSFKGTNKFPYPISRELAHNFFLLIKSFVERKIYISTGCFIPPCIFEQEEIDFFMENNKQVRIGAICGNKAPITDYNLNVFLCPFNEQIIGNLRNDSGVELRDRIVKTVDDWGYTIPTMNTYINKCAECKIRLSDRCRPCAGYSKIQRDD
jgi:MoaA/NifB/PqqE/SkfB family radical SAM enzyme